MIMTFNCIHGMETVIGLVQLRQLGPNARGRVSTERITAENSVWILRKTLLS